jgi:hypothetical protein
MGARNRMLHLKKEHFVQLTAGVDAELLELSHQPESHQRSVAIRVATLLAISLEQDDPHLRGSTSLRHASDILN